MSKNIHYKAMYIYNSTVSSYMYHVYSEPWLVYSLKWDHLKLISHIEIDIPLPPVHVFKVTSNQQFLFQKLIQMKQLGITGNPLL